MAEPDLHDGDRELLKAVRCGERGAAERLAERFACIPAMLRIRERRVGVTLSSEERQDIVQETVAALWIKLDHYTGHRPLEAWIFGFVMREHYKAIERHRRGAAAELGEEQVPVAPEPGEDLEWPRVRAAVAELGPPDSHIVSLRHFESVPFADIGRELAMPTATIKTRYYRALQRLRVVLQPLWREVSG